MRDVIDRTETLTGCVIERAYVARGYRGHYAQNSRWVFISGQKSVFGSCAAAPPIEPVIGHPKTDSHLGRCFP